MKTIFFGSSKYVLPVIETLNKNLGLVLVVTTEKQPTDPVIKFCQTEEIDYQSVSSTADLLSLVNNQSSISEADLGVVADFGIIIPDQIIDYFPKGIINIHPSLLPKYRGPTPVQTAILNGDTKTGITIIKIDHEVDHGPILHQEETDIKPEDTAEELLLRLFQKASFFLPKTISEYIKGTLNLKDQIHIEATFTERFTREDGFIDASKPPEKEELSRMIRAYYSWPGVWTKYKLGDKELVVKFLPAEKIQVEGKSPVSYKDFINGYSEAKNLLQKLGLS